MLRTGVCSAAVAAVALTACSTVVRQPEVRVEGVRVGGIGLQGGLLYVLLEVENPNGFALEANGLTYDIDVRHQENGDTSWVDLVDGQYEDDIRIGSRQIDRLEIPIEFTYREMGGALRTLIDRGSFTYRISGAVALNEPLRRSVPYRKSGVVTLGGSR
ncbi:MAG: LEA type 2 family protein [Longimicrobiales bacterium]